MAKRRIQRGMTDAEWKAWLTKRNAESEKRQKRFQALREARIKKIYAGHAPGWHPPAKTSAGRVSRAKYMR